MRNLTTNEFNKTRLMNGMKWIAIMRRFVWWPDVEAWIVSQDCVTPTYYTAGGITIILLIRGNENL